MVPSKMLIAGQNLVLQSHSFQQKENSEEKEGFQYGIINIAKQIKGSHFSSYIILKYYAILGLQKKQLVDKLKA